jgi:predicted Zn-dependent protease
MTTTVPPEEGGSLTHTRDVLPCSLGTMLATPRHEWLTPARAAALAALWSCVLLSAACAINPATGKRQFVLMSEAQEIQLGRESDPAIVAQYGLYPDDELAAYVDGIGQELAAISERPDLQWTFRVLDDPLVNAFALPGGYVYVTRGILAHMNSEAELASVLGHEIGHVTARHSVSQLSKAQLAQLGLGIGAAVTPESLQDVVGLAGTGVGLLFLKYSRDDERQADDLGLRYLALGGYDPRPMGDMFRTLDRVGEAAGGEGPPTWLLTHPDPERREERIAEAVAAMDADFGEAIVGRDGFLRRTDGMVYGNDPRQGFFRDAVFYHPEMRFRVEFPEGWKTQNTRQAVVGASAAEDAVLRLTLASEATADEATQAFMSHDGVVQTYSRRARFHGLEARVSGFTVRLAESLAEGQLAHVEHDDRVFELLGLSLQDDWPGHEPTVTSALASFGPLTDRRILDLQPARLHNVRADGGMNIEQLARRHGSTEPSTTLALINGLDPGVRLEGGLTYKVVRGDALP